MMPLLLATAISDSITTSVHGIIPGGIVSLIDAAARALLVACIVGAGLRLLAADHVPAQKTAWGLVLAGALLMPIVAPWAGNAAWVPTAATWVVPTHSWRQYMLSRVDALNPMRQSQPAVQAPPAQPAVLPAAQPALASEGSAPLQPSEIAAPAPSQSDRFPAPAISSYPSAAADLSSRPLGPKYYLPISDLVWIVYAAVCLALLLRLAYGIGGAIGLWQSAEPIDLDPELAGGLCLRSSGKITSPVTVGSAVVLPADYEEWGAEKLRVVLAHERSHVRQGDFYLQAMAGLYAAIFWFSPLGWWLKHRLSDLGETISDRAGLEEASSHVFYARILLEFAALPRRAQVGVAMARSRGLSQRIERLLNESSFRDAFAGGRRRLLAAFVLVPAALFAATALIRVQAAQTLQSPVMAHGPIIIQSYPEKAPDLASVTDDTEAQEPQAPPADPAPAQAPAIAPPAPAAPQAPQAVPAPPPPPDDAEDADQEVTDTITTQCNGRSATLSSSRSSSHAHSYSYSYFSDGDSYALVTGKDQQAHFSGDWHNSEIDKARAAAHGDFLWFSHDGKSYVVDDPQVIAEIQGMYKPMEDLGRQQRELGEKQRELGEQQRELGRRQREASIPTPDLSKEMADLNATIARLQAQKGGTITGEQLGEIQRNIGELQSKIGHMDGEIGARQGELGRLQGELGRQQGELGRQQGEIGRQQGRMAREADSKVHSLIDQTMKDGKARPVQ